MPRILALTRKLEGFNDFVGKLVACLTLPMVLGTFLVVVLRYAFDLGWIWMQEGVLWMHAVSFMLAAAYTLKEDQHVRVDIFYRRMSARRKAWVDLVGTLAFLMPVSIFIGVSSRDYVAVSWAIAEGSREAGGLPFPFVPLLKSMIPAMALLLVLQGVAIALQSAATLARGGAEGAQPDESPTVGR